MEKLTSYFCSTLITAVILLLGSNALAELNLFNDISQSTEPEVVQEVDESSVIPLKNVDVGSILKVRESSSDIYFLWDSEASSELMSGDKTKHIRLRIEEGQFEKVQKGLVSIDENNNTLSPKMGVKRQHVQIIVNDNESVTLYPYAENAELLISALEQMFQNRTIGISKTGLVYIIGIETIIYGYLDYFVSKPNAFVFSQFKFSDVVEENGFNTITITYPSGTSQKMYFFQVEISTI